MTSSEQSDTQARFRKGERVVVMNPGPLNRGMVTKSQPAENLYVDVRWDDGRVGWPLADLLVRESEVVEEGDTRS